MTDSEVTLEAARDALVRAAEEWGLVAAGASSFRKYLAKIDATSKAVEAHGPDLALAFMCSLGDQRALAVFEREHLSAIPDYVARLHLSEDLLQELLQILRVSLFTGPSPRIHRYSGKGPLGAWLRIVSLRCAFDELKRPLAEAALDSTLLDLFASAHDVERDVSQAEWRARLHDAVEASLGALTAREKTILRLHYVEGLNVETIGTIYRVHRATVARWILGIRGDVMSALRRTFANKADARSSEIRGLFADLDRQLTFSISRVLRASSSGD
jgi:RNA polymerase sigma-70 factor (ECF subfamily)